MRIFVGNLSYETTDADLQGVFAPFGQVASAQVIMDRNSGRSKGFGFVEMANGTEAQAAIAGLSGKDLKGRAMTVNEARPRTEGGGGQRGGGFGGGRGGDRGGDRGGRW